MLESMDHVQSFESLENNVYHDDNFLSDNSKLPDPPKNWNFNLLLLDISAFVTAEELTKIKPDFFHEQNNPDKTDIDHCSNIFDLFGKLRKHESLKKQDFYILLQVLHMLDRSDLIKETKKHLPDQRKLNSIWRKPGQKKYVLEECEKVCVLIEAISPSVLHVWPAYDTDGNDEIVFVVLTKNTPETPVPTSTLAELGYNLFIKYIDTSSQEGKEVMQSKKNIETRLTYSQLERVGNVINKHAGNLMQRHTYLSAISGSGVRSKFFREGKEGHVISSQPCIILYVLTKGKIPLHEDPFPNDLEGIPVDVREGIFETTTLEACKYHKSLRMGCQITSDNTPGQYGTMGGFCDHPEIGLCGITCAHVVLKEKELHNMWGKKKVWHAASPIVYQPDVSKPIRFRVGPVKEAVYKSGTDDSSGIDVAIFKIEQERAPNSGQFPDDTDLRYETGKTLGTSALDYSSKVTKYGITSGKTEGYLEFKNTVVKKIEFYRRNPDNDKQHPYLLKNQLEIRPDYTRCKVFSNSGDSGAFVFIKDTTGQYSCIGMIVGKLHNDNAIVIPISIVKEELGVSKLYNFSWNNLNERLDAMDEKLNTIINRLGSTSNNPTGQTSNNPTGQ